MCARSGELLRPRGALLQRPQHAGIGQHVVAHAGECAQGGPLDDLLLAIEVDEDRAAHLARDQRGAFVAVLLDEARQVDRLAGLDGEAAIGGEEARHLGQVRGPRERTVVEIQEAALAARALAPEERQGHDVDRRSRIPRGTDRHLEQVELILASMPPAPQPVAKTLGAQEEEERRPAPGERAYVLARLVAVERARLRAIPPHGDAQPLEQGAVVVEVDAVRERREPQSRALQDGVEEEVVEPARVAHHVDDAAPPLELTQAVDGVRVEIEVGEEAALEGPEEQVAARGHGRQGIGARGQAQPRQQAVGRRRRRARRRDRRPPSAAAGAGVSEESREESAIAAESTERRGLEATRAVRGTRAATRAAGEGRRPRDSGPLTRAAGSLRTSCAGRSPAASRAPPGPAW